MLGWILLFIGVIGFGYAGYKDLKTTEFEDWIPYLIIIAALAVRGTFALILGDFSIIINAVLFGLLFLGFGYILYFLKQWGDGDAWLMGALGFLFPDAAGFVPLIGSFMPFPMLLIFNFFMLALIYLIVYALVLGFMTPHIFLILKKRLYAKKNEICVLFAALLAVSAVPYFYLFYFFSVPPLQSLYLFILPFIGLLMILFLQYAKVIEDDLFKRKIPVSRLRVGDVIITDKWRGITEKELRQLQKRGGYVWIKEGVRFSPVFVLNLLLTLFIGSIMPLLFPLS